MEACPEEASGKQSIALNDKRFQKSLTMKYYLNALFLGTWQYYFRGKTSLCLYYSSQPSMTHWLSCPIFPCSLVGYLPNFAILFLFSKSSFCYGFYLKNENEKFLFDLKYKENMCTSWFAAQFTPPIPPPTHQPNAEI